MKRVLLCFLMTHCVCTCIASIVDRPETADGNLLSGEYASAVNLENNEKLIVNGGGADILNAWNSSRIEIYSTSLPLINHISGTYDIYLHDSSTLLFSGGVTESIVIKKDATALLTGGTINLLTIYHRPVDSCSVTIVCQDGWEWLYTSGTITGITGTWKDGNNFKIEFDNVGSPWPPTSQYVNVIPEPATLVLLGFGGWLIRRKR